MSRSVCIGLYIKARRRVVELHRRRVGIVELEDDVGVVSAVVFHYSCLKRRMHKENNNNKQQVQ